jgi:hypothetical protein
LGIHWAFDKTEGITQGRQVADYVFDNVFTPLPPQCPSVYVSGSEKVQPIINLPAQAGT